MRTLSILITIEHFHDSITHKTSCPRTIRTLSTNHFFSSSIPKVAVCSYTFIIPIHPSQHPITSHHISNPFHLPHHVTPHPHFSIPSIRPNTFVPDSKSTPSQHRPNPQPETAYVIIASLTLAFLPATGSPIRSHAFTRPWREGVPGTWAAMARAKVDDDEMTGSGCLRSIGCVWRDAEANGAWYVAALQALKALSESSLPFLTERQTK
ncbi:hypothetical protein FB567DRAFT_142423 [Paraphoma chrysanthemicola]|uniref:Uncharacterized protein n=1 Tax=Paraphoma chrysanthemicola TaxID=798071 RepID=A0A8K0QXE0_9PLEO|nr:hypothetical protein FB567DRAFT_142423 [Paraphoma chrysanthemicola]